MDPQLPMHLRPFVLPVAEAPQLRRETYDVYLPATDGRRPAIVFLHGLYPAQLQPTARDWPIYTGYGSTATTYGATGIVLDVPLHEPGAYPEVARTMAAAIDAARREPAVDADRVAVWCFSGGALLTSEWLHDPPGWLRCLALTYPVLAPLPGWQVDTRYRPAETLSRTAPPIVLSRAGRDRAETAATIPPFLTRADELGIRVDVIDVPDGQHGFEILDHTDASKAAIRTAFRTVVHHLNG